MLYLVGSPNTTSQDLIYVGSWCRNQIPSMKQLLHHIRLHTWSHRSITPLLTIHVQKLTSTALATSSIITSKTDITYLLVSSWTCKNYVTSTPLTLNFHSPYFTSTRAFNYLDFVIYLTIKYDNVSREYKSINLG